MKNLFRILLVAVILAVFQPIAEKKGSFDITAKPAVVETQKKGSFDITELTKHTVQHEKKGSFDITELTPRK